MIFIGYVKFDEEKNEIVAGPSLSTQREGWVPFYVDKKVFDPVREQRVVEQIEGVVIGRTVDVEPDYADLRKEQYPPLSDQLDMIWHEIDKRGTLTKMGDFYTAIAKVKHNNPKHTQH